MVEVSLMELANPYNLTKYEYHHVHFIENVEKVT